ncbi:MAG: hypothetical protein QOJ83_3144 [Frankiales bacterium]|jgi:hypothetical protein|nr:hypothetical protein [Frankiales bacterium]
MEQNVQWVAVDDHCTGATATAVAEAMLTAGLLPGAVPAFTRLAAGFVGTADQQVLVANELVVADGLPG